MDDKGIGLMIVTNKNYDYTIRISICGSFQFSLFKASIIHKNHRLLNLPLHFWVSQNRNLNSMILPRLLDLLACLRQQIHKLCKIVYLYNTWKKHYLWKNLLQFAWQSWFEKKFKLDINSYNFASVRGCGIWNLKKGKLRK